MGFIKWGFKMVISIIFDVVDFLTPPVIGTVYDVVGGLLGFLLWGGKGAIAFWEVLEPTDRIDAFVPTLTIMGILSIGELREPRLPQQ